MTFFRSLDKIANPNPCYVNDDDAIYFAKGVEYVVIWYGRIYPKSNRSNAIKLIEVVFFNTKNAKELKVKLPIEIALKVTIGSIWVNGETIHKYCFDDFSALIEAQSANLSHSNHYKIANTSKKYEFDLSKYPVRGLDKDGNTLLVVRQGDHKILMHPLTFYVAHYGVSKEINRILLSYLFIDVEDMLNLNKPDPKISDIVLIPDSCVIGDAVFLHYLKYDDYAKDKIMGLNRRVIQSLSNPEESNPLKPVKSASLKCEPYHDQPIEMTFKGFEIESKVILCTEITGMSMPQGEDIFYTFEESSKSDFDPDRLQKRVIKPLFDKISSNEIVVEVEKDAGNSTIAVTRQRIATIGEIRQLIKTENISSDQAIQSYNSKIIPLKEPIPSSYAVGGKKGSDSSVGIMQALISSGAVDELKNLSFKKLLNYAQSLKGITAYRGVRIDCYRNGQLYGETTDELNRPNTAKNVVAVYVLRIMTNSTTYYFFDCTIKTGIKTSGLAIKVTNDSEFQARGVGEVLSQLYDNDGRLSSLAALASSYGPIVRFNHASSESSNWVATAIGKL